MTTSWSIWENYKSAFQVNTSRRITWAGLQTQMAWTFSVLGNLTWVGPAECLIQIQLRQQQRQQA